MITIIMCLLGAGTVVALLIAYLLWNDVERIEEELAFLKCDIKSGRKAIQSEIREETTISIPTRPDPENFEEASRHQVPCVDLIIPLYKHLGIEPRWSKSHITVEKQEEK